MTQDEIIEMPEYLNASYEGDDLYTGDQVRELMKLVAAKEREACAKVCDSEKKWWNGMSHSENDIYQAIDNISACIQARGEA